MGLFRRKPLHERLLAQGGDQYVFHPPELFPLWDADRVNVHGGVRRREWDCVRTVQAPGVKADATLFVVLANGDVVVIEGDEKDDLSPFADAIDGVLVPPYRAQAVRQRGDMFAVGALVIDVVELPDATAEVVILTVQDGVRELQLDEERVFGGIPALERLGEAAGRSYVVRAERFDAALDQVRVDAL